MKSVKTITTWASRAVESQATKAFNKTLQLIKEPLSLVEKEITDQSRSFDVRMKRYIDDACGGSGKRLRPVLALLTGGACGGLTQEHQRLALILELIHIASLIHDDIMDEAGLRRERPTLHAKWGNATSVLVGDLLFAHALKLSADFSNSEISRCIADATLDVCSGEILQTERRFDVHLNLQEYYRIIAMKTGSLFRAACELGAVISKATPAVVEALRHYGNNIGIAYQILDDCIDLIGNEKNIGKTLGTDLQHGKFTLPILFLLQSCSEAERNKWHDYLLHKKEKDLHELGVTLLEQGALNKAVAEAQRLIEEANEKLDLVGKNSYSEGLRGIASYILSILRTMEKI
ncbi:MAG: polyprenyl synthetase family protein [Verrucomicrobia bacterium]|nr:polyprenyl synthetase family protein [Verrucomicrobiota bacterium]